MDQSDSVSRAGAIFGNYRVVRELGRGGMGAVYFAEHKFLPGKVAAVKVLLPESSRDRAMTDRFFKEAIAISLVKHPGIVEVFDCGFQGDQAYIVMEYLQGESLGAHLRRVGRLDLSSLLVIASQIACAVEAAHAQGIVHRDLKPDNVFLTKIPDQGISKVQIKVLDFGIAKLLAQAAMDMEGAAKTKAGSLLGTPLYMSPEQCQGEASIDGRADVYALGCMMFEMACGRPPFVGGPEWDLMAAHVRATPPVPRDLVPSLPDKLEFLILRALAKQPGARPQTMAALAAELSAIDPASAGGSTLIRDTGEADADTVGPNKTSLLPTGGGPGKTTLSAATMETADHAGAAGRPARSRGTMVFVMGAAVVASAGAIVWIAGHQTTDRAEISRAEPRATVAQPLPTAQPQPAHEPSPLSAPAPMLALETVIAANPAPAPAARSAFPKAAESVAGRRPASLSKISIDSVPPGARVCWVGSAKLLGKTPLEIDLAEVGSRARLLLEHAGYRSQEVKLPVGGPVALRKLGPDDFEDVSLCGTEK